MDVCPCFNKHKLDEEETKYNLCLYRPVYFLAPRSGTATPVGGLNVQFIRGKKAIEKLLENWREKKIHYRVFSMANHEVPFNEIGVHIVH